MAGIEEIENLVGKPRAACKKCKLETQCKSPQMYGAGNSDKPLMAIVGDVPSEADDALDQPFSKTFDSDKIRMALRANGVDPDADVWWTNAVRCRPAKGKATDPQTKHCREFLLDELAAVEPTLILTLGASALLGATGRKGIANLHGVPQVISAGEKRIPLIATYSVAHASRDPLLMDEMCDDIEQAIKIAKNGGEVKRLPVNYRVIKNDADKRELVREICQTERLSWDIETSGLDAFAPDARVSCIAFSAKPQTGWLLLIDHDDADSITDLSRGDRVDFARYLLEKSPAKLYGQNLKYDMCYVRANLNINPRQPFIDTYIAHHLLYEDASMAGGNGLKSMARRYTDMGDYEQAGIMRHGGEKEFYAKQCSLPVLANADVAENETLTYYACSDVDAVLRIADHLLPKLEAEGQMPVLALEMYKTMMLTDLEFNGAAIDWEYLAELKKDMPARLAKLEDELRSFPQVALAQRYHAQRDSKTGKPRKEEPFNPASPMQVACLIFDVLQLPPGEVKTATGNDSIGKENLELWQSMVAEGSDASRILSLIAEIKKLSKLISGYIEAFDKFKMRDDKIHANFNQGRVVTWRLSSSEPNLQQLPRNDDGEAEGGKGAIKRLFVGGKPGWWVAEIDYSQIELRIAGLVSQDAGFLDTYEAGLDLHERTARSVFNVPAGQELEPRLRTYAKAVNFGILYGMEAPALSRRLRIDMSEAERMIRGFWREYQGFAQWSKDVQQHIIEHGYITSMFGHRRHLPMATAGNPGERAHALRQGQNYTIQNTASNIAMYSEANLQTILKEDGFQSYCFGQVHDSIWLTGPPEELDTVIPLAIAVLENPGFDFLTGADPRYPRPVPIKVDAKVGFNLCEMKNWEA